MKFGIWFTNHPTAVISTYLTNDLVPIDLATNSDFREIKEWSKFIDKIDFCVITIMNHKDKPGKSPEIKEFVNEMKKHGHDVFLGISCLLVQEGGFYKRLSDFHKEESINWICPSDDIRFGEIWSNLKEICSYYNPTVILLWHATFPSENFCYRCPDCLSDYDEFDIEKRTAKLTELIDKIRQKMNEEDKYRNIKLAIEVDVEGRGNIEYQYGVNLKTLAGKIDYAIFHVIENDEKSLKRVHQLSTEAKKCKITPIFYVSVLHKEHFIRVYERISKNKDDRVLVYSPKKNSIDDVSFFFVTSKWTDKLKQVFDLGLGFSAVNLFLSLKYSIELPRMWVILGYVFSVLSILNGTKQLNPLLQYFYTMYKKLKSMASIEFLSNFLGNKLKST